MANILLADDDLVALRLLSGLLKSVGHKVDTAVDGYDAVEKLNKNMYQLFIVDASMPKVSGFNAVATVRKIEKYNDMPILFLTGRRHKSDVMRAMSVGADDYIVKPVVKEMFLERVEKLLSKRRFNDVMTIMVEQAANWKCDFTIKSVSKQGLTVTSKSAFPAHFEFQLVTDLFKDVGLETVSVRVVNDQKDKDTGIHYYELKFTNATEIETEKIKEWMSLQIAKKTAA